MPCSRSCCGTDTLNLTQAPALPHTGCTDSPIRAYPQPTRQIAPLRYGRVSGERTEALVAQAHMEVTGNDERKARRAHKRDGRRTEQAAADTCPPSGIGADGGLLPGESQHASGDRVTGAGQGPHSRRGRHRGASRVPRLRNYGLRNSVNQEPASSFILWITWSKMPECSPRWGSLPPPIHRVRILMRSVASCVTA